MDITYSLLSHQKKFMQSTKHFTCLSCGRGSGKSYVASLLAAMKLIQGKRLIVWAQTYKALSENLMTEIANRLDEMHVRYDYNRGSQKITYKKGTIYGLSYENIEACRGFTEIEIAICDEIALAPAQLLATMAFCLRGQNIHPHIYAMSTPRMNTWWNLYLKDHADEIDLIHATTLDNKFITEEQIELMKSTCVDENMLRQELYGEIVDDTSAGMLFSMKFLRSCIDVPICKSEKGYAIGVDCSGLGNDSNVIVLRKGNEIKEIIERKVATASEMCSLIRGLVHTYGEDNLSHICIDEAFGLDLNERLKESGIYCSETVPFGGSPSVHAYLNNRAEMYMNMKKSMEEFGLLGLTDELQHELSATRYLMNSSNKIQLIPKSEIKVNIGRSPDIADALALTYHRPIISRELLHARRDRQKHFMD